jgi:hypothetical protein
MTLIGYAMNAHHLASGYGVLQYEGPAIKFDNPKWRQMVGFADFIDQGSWQPYQSPHPTACRN